MGLLLKGGEVLDPGAGLAGALDVRLREGRVAEVGAGLAADGDRVVTTPPVPMAELLTRPGDIVTHFLHGRGDGILDARGELKKEVWAARERGVVFDVGHGRRHLNFDVARAAFRQRFLPDTISSDLNTPAAAGVARDLPHTMAKFLGLGLPLPEVIRAVTASPAALLGRAGELGTLRPGAAGDVAVFERRGGAVDLEDNDGGRITGNERLVPMLTVKDGEVWWRAGA